MVRTQARGLELPFQSYVGSEQNTAGAGSMLSSYLYDMFLPVTEGTTDLELASLEPLMEVHEDGFITPGGEVLGLIMMATH